MQLLIERLMSSEMIREATSLWLAGGWAMIALALGGMAALFGASAPATPNAGMTAPPPAVQRINDALNAALNVRRSTLVELAHDFAAPPAAVTTLHSTINSARLFIVSLLSLLIAIS